LIVQSQQSASPQSIVEMLGTGCKIVEK
jgi:hypothetical protein